MKDTGNNELFLLHSEIIKELQEQTQTIINPVVSNVVTRQQAQKAKDKVKGEIGLIGNTMTDEEEEESESVSDESGPEVVTKEEDNEGDYGISQFMQQPEEEGIKDWNVTETMAGADLFVKQQKEDPALESWWKLTEKKGSGFVIIKELLYKIQMVCGQNVHQLVLPTCRRMKVLNMVHDSIFGGHLALRKHQIG